MNVWTTIFSILALVVSGIAIKLSIQANNIERNRDKVELEKGKTALFNLTSRYFIVNYQRTEFNGTKFKVKTDSHTTANYVKELELIASQFDDLMTSSFYTELYKKYSMIGSSPVFIRKEIMYIKLNQSKGQPYGYDHDVWDRMFSNFEKLRGEIKLEDNEWSKFLDEVYRYAKLVNETLSSKN